MKTMRATKTKRELVLTLSLVLLVGLGAVAALASPPEVYMRPLDEATRAFPPLPPTTEFPVQLVVDDDSTEGAVGVGNVNAEQFLWFNEFPVTGPFDLQEIWVLFPAGPNMSVGAEIQLVVYFDADSDPTNGAELLMTVDETIQAVDDTTFSVYPLGESVPIRDPGSVLIGVVNRFVESGVSIPTESAAIDRTASQGQSWLATWTGDPPTAPELPTDDIMIPIDVISPGNWMIRGFGVGAPVIEVPTLSEWALMGFVLALAFVSVLQLNRRKWRLGRLG